MAGYKNQSVRETHYLKVSDVHTLYVEECGKFAGVPVVFLHGGPGSCITEQARTFFDPKYYRIILFDQRGCAERADRLRI